MILLSWNCLAPEHEDRCTQEKPYHFSSPRAKRRTNIYMCGGSEVGIRCDGEGCMKEMEFKDHHWDMIKAASKEGWFFRKDETLHLCIDHLTIELVAWRDWNNPGWRGRLTRGLGDKLPTPEEAKRVALRRQLGYNGISRDEPTRGGSDEQRRTKQRTEQDPEADSDPDHNSGEPDR